ncbi:hypothetical protein LSUB1_G000223 [Lachnellula subtilissima]|uniref:Zn(2)-C6 fungal-type domain-containing protein n=1 Tax=Lachnellula subtilissima TaxID=602034 RepID=A0A8H8S384_9HELO|nr:hypothetical protein LSUB1_G000223 [Lachnellula subtilissima]
MENRQFICRHAGCGKSFARKEHLGRHEKAHDPSNLLQCPACQRNFNRKFAYLLPLQTKIETNFIRNSDSLQRHVVKHGAAFKQIPSGRAKRTCFTCRVSKLKCDKNDPCFSCVKKGVQCKFQHDGDNHRPSRDASSSTAPGTSQSLNHNLSTATAAKYYASNVVDDTITQQTSLKDLYTRHSEDKPRGLIDWTLVEIQPDPHVPAHALKEVNSLQKDAQKYREIYFKQFHHRWPIEHRVSREYDGKDTDLCELSIRMIGAWLHGTSESVDFAVETHNELMDELMTRLSNDQCQVSSQDRFEQSLPAWMCHAAVLNIIFGLYRGADEKKGYFVPMRTIKEEKGKARFIHQHITKSTNDAFIQKPNNAATLPEKESFRKDLERLRARFDAILAQKPHPSSPNFGHEKLLPYRYYYGMEDHTQAGWQEPVINRVNDLLFDTQMLLLLLDLHLSLDIPNLVQVARDQTPSAIEEGSATFPHAREHRRLCMGNWTSAPAARSAVCRAIDILVIYQNFVSSSGPDTSTRTLDPICHIALCTSALIIWAYCQIHDDDDQTCHKPGPDLTTAIELTVCGFDSGSSSLLELEAWIETGGASKRPLIHGVQLCRRNTKVLIGIFRECIPDGWGLVDVIAPGIF